MNILRLFSFGNAGSPWPSKPARPRRLRNSSGQLLEVPQGRGAAGGISSLLLFFLILLSLSALLLSKNHNREIENLRTRALDLAAPMLEMAAIPAGYVQRSLERLQGFYNFNAELNKLRRENRRLRSIKWDITRLRHNNSQLKALLNSVGEQHYKFISGRIISGNPGLFGRRLTINLGRQNGIGDGFAVINAQGFIGRTINAGQRTSMVMLLADPHSRTPVVIGPGAVRALAIGRGQDELEIGFLAKGAKINDGDLVITSGQGGQLPGGLKVGVVRLMAGKHVIVPAARHQGTEYISVIRAGQNEPARTTRP